jgi:hypothetical protein
MIKAVVTPLAFQDQQLAALDLPGGRLTVTRGLGSGLSRAPNGRIWAVGDRGPNLKLKLARERYGLTGLTDDRFGSGAKLMPFSEIGPALSELRVDGDSVAIVRTLPIGDRDGRPISGFPIPGGAHCATEPAVTLSGDLLPPDPSGADTEGIVALADGSLWVGDEYGPSLIHVAGDGTVIERWVPAGMEQSLSGARYPVRGALPALAGKRQLNRGFEAIGISPDQDTLYLAFQSPLAHPDEQAHKQGRWVRFWTLDARSGSLTGQFAYPLDPPETFERDGEEGEVDWSDLKVSELTVLGPGRLLVLERASATTKLYRVELEDALKLDPAHGDLGTRPTLEELSRTGAAVPLLRKTLVLDTDAHPEIGPDLEGMIMLGPDSLLLVNDNDFGAEGVATRLWRVEFSEPL